MLKINDSITPITHKSNTIKNNINYNCETNTKASINHNVNPLTYTKANIRFGARPLNQLYDEYNWFIRHDKTPAINAFLKINDDQKTMDTFLTAILNSDDRGYEFIDSIIRQPRESIEIKNKLAEKIGSNSINLITFMPNSPYNNAYNKYLNSKYENAHTLSELLRIRPDWKGDKLIEKYRALKGNDNLEIGNPPKEFPDDHLFLINQYLTPFMDIGMKFKKKINALTIDNRTYEFAFFTEGRSEKNVFGIFTPEKEKYIIKMGKPEFRSLDRPFAIGTLAKIDRYLTTNRSRNSAPICYYNHKNNFSVYKYIEHQHIDNPKQNDLQEISKHLPDFKALGLTYNDTVGDKNFFILNKNSNGSLINTEGFEEGINNQEWISVDNDHVTYSNLFNPLNSVYCATLPNAMQMFF